MKWNKKTFPFFTYAFLSLAVLSCTQEEHSHLIQLEIVVKGASTPIEWSHLEGIWQKENNTVFIEALGFGDELFKLYLPNVKDTGIQYSPYLQSLVFHDGKNIFNKPVSGYIRIQHINAMTVEGKLEATYQTNNSISVDTILRGYFKLSRGQ